MSCAILGIGSVSALGCGVESLKAGLAGSVAPLIETHKYDTVFGETAVNAYTASINGLERFLPRNALRRMDRLSQMSLLASFLAIEDGGLVLEDRARIGIVFGSGYGPMQTTFGFLDSLIDHGDKLASPTLFANSVHNALAAQATIALKINGPCLTVTSFEQTAHSVLATAMGWLHGGQVDYVLAGMGDEFCPLRGYSTAALNRGGCSGVMRPLSLDRCSHVPGEGFITFLLGKGDVDGSYCRLTAATVGRFDAAADLPHEQVFIAANGIRETAEYYRPILSLKKSVVAYASLYGGMPAGNGFDVAFAALSLRDGIVYRLEDERTATPIAADAGIDCVGFGVGGSCSIITLEGRRPVSGSKQ